MIYYFSFVSVPDYGGSHLSCAVGLPCEQQSRDLLYSKHMDIRKLSQLTML